MKGFILALLVVSIGGAQTTGYITGTNSLTSFDASTGAIINTFGSGGNDTQFAVASDDSTLYIPVGSQITHVGSLSIISGASGQMLNSIALPVSASKVILSADGSTAYVLCSLTGNEGDIYVINLATLSVTGSLIFPEFAPPVDIALSPDATKLYVSISGSASGAQGCHTRGICVFDTSTLTLTGHVDILYGNLGISNDGNSLYVTSLMEGSRARVVDTATLAISAVPVNNGIYDQPEVDPLGHWVVLFGIQEPQSTAMIYTINTLTNKPVGELATTFPGFTSPDGIGSAAFAPDGKSVWVLAACLGIAQSNGCTTVNNTPLELVGFSFPSGALISQTPVPSDSRTIAFPQ